MLLRHRLAGPCLLGAQAWAAGWVRNDDRGFEQTISALVDTAHAVARAAFGKAPAQRARHRAHSRALRSGGPAAAARECVRCAFIAGEGVVVDID